MGAIFATFVDIAVAVGRSARAVGFYYALLSGSDTNITRLGECWGFSAGNDVEVRPVGVAIPVGPEVVVGFGKVASLDINELGQTSIVVRSDCCRLQTHRRIQGSTSDWYEVRVDTGAADIAVAIR
jgi:hypothetical protein